MDGINTSAKSVSGYGALVPLLYVIRYSVYKLLCAVYCIVSLYCVYLVHFSVSIMYMLSYIFIRTVFNSSVSFYSLIFLLVHA